MSIKKQEMPAYDGRAIQGMALEYATSNRGGCHVRGYMTAPEIVGLPVKLDPLATEEKAEWPKAMQDLTALVDSARLCLFTVFGIGLPEIRDMLNACLGLDMTEEDYIKTGERIWNLERIFNNRAGLTGADDTLPPRLLEEPLKNGPAAGKVARLDVMLPECYKLRGWNEDGEPTEEKLKELLIM